MLPPGDTAWLHQQEPQAAVPARTPHSSCRTAPSGRDRRLLDPKLLKP